MENEEKTVVCPECGSKDIGKKYNDEYFCRNCGYDVISCRQCGSFDIKKGAGGILFCRDCGTKITSAVPANETIIGDISTAKETTAEKASGTKKSQIISIFIVAAITLAVVILTLVFAKFDCSLINEWTYDDDDNKVIYRFNKDGTFTEKEGSLTVNGTYTVDNNKINLNYNYIDLDLKNEFTYSISGDIMTLSIDVGTGFISSDYRCTSINRNFLIKLIIVIIEIAIATIICIIFVKKKKKNENDDDDEKYVDMCVDDYYQQKTSKHIKIVTLIVSIIALLTTFAILTAYMIIPRYNLYRSYKYAIDLKNSGKYSEAISAFDALGDYKDSQAQKKLTSNEYLKSLKVGDIILFGEYEQDNNIENGKENIEWLVLDKANNGCLIISKYALDCQLYNTSRTDVTWETCTLRTWLNDTFYNSAFSDAEKSKIAKSTVSADKNPIYSTDPGNATSDNVFLLTITEANKYFKLDETRKCVPTAYAKAQGAYTSNDYKTASGEATCLWWLRSPGYYLNYAAYVFYDGGINDYGLSVSYGDFAVRPAMWITLN